MKLNSYAACGHVVLPAFLFFAVFLVGNSVEKRAQWANSTLLSSTFGHDAKTLDLQWIKNLTTLKHQRTKFAVVVLMQKEEFVTRRWMGDGRVDDTTIFLKFLLSKITRVVPANPFARVISFLYVNIKIHGNKKEVTKIGSFFGFLNYCK